MMCLPFYVSLFAIGFRLSIQLFMQFSISYTR